MDTRFLRSVLWKTLVLFAGVNLVFGGLNWRPVLGKVSAYNLIFPGRQRFPFGETPEKSYSLNTYNLDTMFSTLEINRGIKSKDEFRIIMIGDSSVWGTLQHPEETIAAQLQSGFPDLIVGKKLKVYNLGYPTDSTFKDLLILDKARQYQPDLFIWMVTLDSMAAANQLNSPVILQNKTLARQYIQSFNLSIPQDSLNEETTIWSNSLVVQRKELAEWLRLQLYGFMWASTGIDQYYPPVYSLAQRDLDQDTGYLKKEGPLHSTEIALDVVQAGMTLAGNTPILLVNEPILISSGSNSDIRYNFNYPRWAYDQYREILANHAGESNWIYMDLWNAVPESEFTNTAFHITPTGVKMIINPIADAVKTIARRVALPPVKVVFPTPTSQPKPATQATQTGVTTLPVEITALPTETPTPGVIYKSPTQGTCADEKTWQTMPVVPDHVSEKMHSIYSEGIKKGNRPDVISIIGDCQNVPSVFLGAFEKPDDYTLGKYAYLQPVIDQFGSSFGRKGMARHGGLNIAGVLNPSQADRTKCQDKETPLDCELRLNKPGIVIISLEEWWAGRPVDVYQSYLNKVLEKVIASGAVPILSTKADNLEGNQAINKIVVKTACQYQAPVWNFWAAAQKLPSKGLWTDRFHLTVGTYDFSDPAQLKTGRTIRNLTALQSLDFVWRALNNMPQNTLPVK